MPQPGNVGDVAAILSEPAPGLDALKAAAFARLVSSVNLDVFSSAYVTSYLKDGKAKPPGSEVEVPTLTLALGAIPGVRAAQIHVPIKAAAAGTLKLHALGPNAAIVGLAVNGAAADKLAPIAFKAGEIKLISITLPPAPPSVGFEWVATEPAKK
ncbi:MAG: hypothetical protein NTW19_05555 [Planctomycetota bacterium]|nr:hypothetical protein [Planctomycetota bacterium]